MQIIIKIWLNDFLSYLVQLQFIHNSLSNSADRQNKQQITMRKTYTLCGTGETDIYLYTLND